jgi:hypothetical protein
MFEGVPSTEFHPTLTFALDLADKLIKLAAVALGGVWTWWNYRKSRTYAQKLDLQLTGDVFFKDGLYVNVAIVLKNLGAAKHLLQSEGTSCEIVAIRKDLSKEEIRIFPVFTLHDQVEPGESINDHVVWRIETRPADIVWLRIDLRVVSGKVEWNTTSMVRVEDNPAEH